MSNERMTEIKSVQQEPEREQRIFTFKMTQLIWLFLGILEALIALRIALKLIGANPESPIVALIYGLTYLFLFPFEGMTSTPAAGGMVLGGFLAADPARCERIVGVGFGIAASIALLLALVAAGAARSTTGKHHRALS